MSSPLFSLNSLTPADQADIGVLVPSKVCIRAKLIDSSKAVSLASVSSAKKPDNNLLEACETISLNIDCQDSVTPRSFCFCLSNSPVRA